MKLTEYSHNRLLETMVQWDVPKDYKDALYNYVVYGYEPGGCFTSVLANDFYMAIQRSHPMNTIQAFKSIAGWINEVVPREARGSYDAVEHWCNLDSKSRRSILEKNRVIFTEKDETWMALKGTPTREPYFNN